MVITIKKDAVPQRKGGADYIKTSHGLKKIRVWSPHDGMFRLTALGKKYYRNQPSEYVISLPVSYHVERRDKEKTVD